MSREKTNRAATLSLCLSVALFAASCGSDFSRPDTTGHDVSLSVRPFYKELMDPNGGSASERIVRLTDAYGDYFEGFCEFGIGVGNTTAPECAANLEAFLAMPGNAEIMAACDSLYATLDVDDAVSDAFSCFGALFPGCSVPKEVYAHFAGFGNQIVMDTAYVSFAVEYYLGSDCRFYRWLQWPQYTYVTLTPDYIVPDMLRAWILGSMPCRSERDDVLSELIYQGSVLYATHRCIPSLSKETLFGFTPEQIKWCEANEGRMWAAMAEQKLLYSTDVMTRSKLVNEGPFTAFFGQKSPGRAALFCAYNIVCEYMKAHPEVSLPTLMSESDPQKVLRESRYNP